jgi:hypothetical protein
MSITKLTTNGIVGAKYDTVSADNYYMEPIATQLLTSTQATITFDNIPQGYKHLQLRQIARLNVSDTGTEITGFNFNGDTSASYARHNVYGIGSGTPTASASVSQTICNAGAIIQRSTNTSVFSVGITDFLDYSNVNKFKTVRTLGGADDNGAGWIELRSGLWMNTAPITKILLTPSAAINFGVNSRFSLYGIRG